MGDLVDARQLPEDERADEEEDDDGERGPRELELRRAVDRRPVLEAVSLLSPVLHDEGDQQALHEKEDPDDEDRHEDVAVPDPAGVRRLGSHRGQAPALGQRDGCREQSEGQRPEPDLHDAPAKETRFAAIVLWC